MNVDRPFRRLAAALAATAFAVSGAALAQPTPLPVSTALSPAPLQASPAGFHPAPPAL